MSTLKNTDERNPLTGLTLLKNTHENVSMFI